MIKTVTIEDVRAIGTKDAIEACNESGSTETPDGGWDSWLINGIGIDATCELFGENPAENHDGWSDSMSEKLIAYSRAAIAAAESLSSED
jgi:hypothetical protein